jgi:hypothetical protein
MRAVSLVTLGPPPDMVEEFNAWYDTEHLPDRAVLPGFSTPIRYVVTHGWPLYLTVYNLEAISALDNPAYLAMSNDRSTPWTKRIVPRCAGRYRFIGNQILGPEPTQKPATSLAFFRLGAIPDGQRQAVLGGLRNAVDRLPAGLAGRAYEAGPGQAPEFVLLVEQHGAVSHPGLGGIDLGAAAPFVDLQNLYGPYWK